MNGELPRLLCPARTLGELTADADSPLWRDIAPVEMRLAADGAQPQQKTWVRTAWSPDDWRILFVCEDKDPWATLTARDARLFEEETVEVFVDPVGDAEAYFEFETNPLGAMLDIVFRRSRSGYKGDWAWNCDGWKVRVSQTQLGWSVEMAIPFSEIAERPQPGTFWRVNFCRIDRPSRDGSLPRELTAWSPPLRETFHTPERFGFLEFTQ
jgi:hypothetical protein